MRRALLAALAGTLLAGAVIVGAAAPASAHVVPSTTITLAVHEDDITAAIVVPADDLATASGIEVSDPLSTTAADEIAAYLTAHTDVSGSGGAWTVAVGDVAATEVEQWGTGTFSAVTATATLTPPAGASVRSFTLAYDAIIHQVVSSDIYVILGSDWATGTLESAVPLGTIALDTVTGTVPPLTIDLDDGSAWSGFAGMLTLGVSHIAEGTDHQLFLLTLLLPAPLLAIGGRWRGPAPVRSAVRRILTITIAFTVGHSVTLALGAVGMPVPQQAVEALIAASILVAAAHAIRPIFPGREAIVAGLFGLVHGLAFSATLSALDLSGGRLVLSLLGFNLGIELMQLFVVAVVLPPLIVLARTRAYTPLRVTAASLTAVAATGWLLERIGVSNPVGTAADLIGAASGWIAGTLWIAAIAVVATRRGRRVPHAVPAAATAPSPTPDRSLSGAR